MIIISTIDSPILSTIDSLILSTFHFKWVKFLTQYVTRECYCKLDYLFTFIFLNRLFIYLFGYTIKNLNFYIETLHYFLTSLASHRFYFFVKKKKKDIIKIKLCHPIEFVSRPRFTFMNKYKCIHKTLKGRNT